MSLLIKSFKINPLTRIELENRKTWIPHVIYTLRRCLHKQLLMAAMATCQLIQEKFTHINKL